MSWLIFIGPNGASISFSTSSRIWYRGVAIKRRDELAEIKLSQINALGRSDVNTTLRHFLLSYDTQKWHVLMVRRPNSFGEPVGTRICLSAIANASKMSDDFVGIRREFFGHREYKKLNG